MIRNALARPTRSLLALVCLLAVVLFTLATGHATAGYHAPTACVPGPHSGIITADETWCLVDSPHLLEGTVTVQPGVTLTVEPGAVVQVPGVPWYTKIIVQGELVAAGTADQLILFTHADVYTWGGIVVDGGSALLMHTTVEWACGNDAQPQSNVAVLNGGQLEMTDSTLRECHYGGGAGERMLYIENAQVAVENTTFTASDEYPIYILGASSAVTLTENIIDGNYYDTILLGAGAMMGHDTTLYPQVAWDGYRLEATYTVPAGITLTLRPGVVVSAPRLVALVVLGELRAQGTETDPILFTGVGWSGVYDWGGVLVNGGGARLAHTTVEQAISSTATVVSVLNGGRLELADSTLQGYLNFDEALLHVENATANAERTTFTGAQTNNIRVWGDSAVLIADSAIEDAGVIGLLVEGDEAFVRVTGSSILSNGTWSGDGVRNTGEATVILSGDPAQGNFIAFNQAYGANQSGPTGQIIATYNYWGDPSGPTHSGNPGGTGEPVTDRVLYDPWLTEPPTGTLPADLVQSFGPNYVSSGETLNIGYLLNNVLTETLHSAVLVGQLPEEAEYIQSTPDGAYWPGRHQVVWKLGDVAPGESAYRAVQVRYDWGLAAHLVTYSSGLAAAENLPNDLIDLDEYLAYEEVTVTSFEELSDQALVDLLAANPDMDALYQDAVAQGFAYYGAAQLQHLSDGTDQVSLPMIQPNAPGETIYLSHRVTGSQRLHETPTSLLGNCPAASYEYDYPTGRLDVWDPFAPLEGRPFGGARSRTFSFGGGQSSLLGCDDFGLNDCLRNCLLENLYSHQFDEGASSHCRNCYLYGDDCSLCAFDLSFFHSPAVETAVEQCQDICGDPGRRDLFKCDRDSRQCVNSHTRLVTPCEDCELDTSQNYLEACPENTRCVNGACKPIFWPETHPLEVLVGGDPNHMVGPEAMAPGQTISYTIAFENVGEGTAYGVYVESRLPDLYDAGTLLLHDGGVHFPASRTLLWDVGELAPGAGGTVSFEVQVPTEALSGTVTVASATVYFPSVPETTPTGDVVSIVQDVVAYSQRVETAEGVAAPVTLDGYTPTGNPLAFEVAVDPLQGELSGSAPDLVYTPADGFEGVDYFIFRVSDGLNTSLPATVMVVVRTGAESEPPLVLYTSPRAGAVDVPILDTPLGDGTYVPAVLAWFSEPLDPATVTPGTVRLTGPGGDVQGTVVFVAGPNRVEFRPGEPLQPGTLYTATITTGVHDSSGNAMATDYVWSFGTAGGHRIHLPLILRSW